MPIEDATVRHVARLARLDLTEPELRELHAQLSRILDYIASIRELDLEGTEPLAHAGDFTNPLRDDRPADSIGPRAALSGAPEARDGFFLVPPVIE
jgi:aspartyl-tRNA(Asn)/glutamyl-tRNA(Gln) amidotransferase subunit C